MPWIVVPHGPRSGRLLRGGWGGRSVRQGVVAGAGDGQGASGVIYAAYAKGAAEDRGRQRCPQTGRRTRGTRPSAVTVRGRRREVTVRSAGFETR